MSIAILSRSLKISGTVTGTVVTVLLLVTKQTPPLTCVRRSFLNMEKLEFPSTIKESGIESFSHVSSTAAISKRSVLNKS